MSLVTCVTCGGMYQTIGADGVPYAHVCPPIAAVKVRRADGTIAIVAPDQVAADDAVLATLALPRKNGRNENPDLTQKPVDGKYPIVSGGAGVTVIDDAAPVLIGLPDAVAPTAADPPG